MTTTGGNPTPHDQAATDAILEAATKTAAALYPNGLSAEQIALTNRVLQDANDRAQQHPQAK